MHEPRSSCRGGRRRQLRSPCGSRGSVETLLFSGATAVVALHAAVDSFIAPEPGTGPRDHLAARPRHTRAPDRGGLPLPAPARRCTGSDRGGARRTRARGSRARDRGRPRRRRARRGLDRLPARPGRPRPARARGRTRLALAQAGPAPLAPPRRRSRSSRSSSAHTGSSSRSRWRSSPPTAPAPRSTPVDLGRPYEQVTLRTSDGLAARRLVCPLAQRSGRDLLPDSRRGSCRRRGCSSATATASCSSTRAATTAAKATRTCSAGTTPKTSTPPSPGCSSGRT